MSKPHPVDEIVRFLGDTEVPEDHRKLLLRAAFVDPHPALDQLAASILRLFEANVTESDLARKRDEYLAALRELESGPLRAAAVLQLLPAPDGGSFSHAHVSLEDGSLAYSLIAHPDVAATLEPGDQVLVDGRGKAVLRVGPAAPPLGDEAILERNLGEGRLEVVLNDRERAVFFASRPLQERLRSGEIQPGRTLLVNVRQRFAHDVLPPVESLSHFRFLSRQPVPDVDLQRDLGCPHAILGKLGAQIRDEMTRPEIRRRYGLRRSSMSLFNGRPGTGKTVSIESLWRLTYEIMSEVTGVPVADLPPRVFRLRSSEILSQWLGQSDQNLDRFFDEVQQVAATPWKAPDGREHELPVLVILEEIDGLARSRGQDPVYDRILTTLLQRLDPNRAELKDKLVLFIGTTNHPAGIDSAMMRRIGSNLAHFGPLNRHGFTAVLGKRLRGLPLDHGSAPQPLESLLADLASWLFSPRGSDPGLIELTYAGATAPEVRHRRDFLTGALIDRAVHDAAEAAAAEGADGLRLDHLVHALDTQLRDTAANLTEHNAHQHLDLPDAVRIATVRRLPQPEFFPGQLLSA
jgi:ATP-dependent 26S proteasome regulatory subunit